MTSNAKNFILLGIGTIAILILAIPYIVSTYAQMDNTVNNYTDISNYIVISSINLDRKTVDLKFDSEISSNSTFKAIVMIPGAANELLPNATKEKNGSWYHLIRQNDIERDVPLQSTFAPNLWPFESYEIDYYIILNKIVPVTEKNSDVGFEGALIRQYIWTVDQTFSIDSPKTLDPKIYIPFDKNSITVVHHKIMMQHNPQYVGTNFPFWIITSIPVTILIFHWRYVRSKDISVHATLFAGVIVISFTILLAIKPYFPPEFTLIELVLIGSIIAYSIKFCHMLKNLGPINSR